VVGDGQIHREKTGKLVLSVKLDKTTPCSFYCGCYVDPDTWTLDAADVKRKAHTVDKGHYHGVHMWTHAGYGRDHGACRHLISTRVTGAESPVHGRDRNADRMPPIRIGFSADPHLHGRASPRNEAHLLGFIDAMAKWQPDLAVDLGDFGVQCRRGPADGTSTPDLHDCQLAALAHHWSVYSQMPFPTYLVMGNHDAGWLKGGNEITTPKGLCENRHAGEDITKAEWLSVTGMPGRFYSFDMKGYHFIVLDGNNAMDDSTVSADHDGVIGQYWIDAGQKAWLAADLGANRSKPKIVLCHEELHYTRPEGSGEGGDVPFPQTKNLTLYTGNGWQIREMFTADGNVLACFFGHRHLSRWTVYGGVHYITLAALHDGGSYARVTIGDELQVAGEGEQKCYALAC